MFILAQNPCKPVTTAFDSFNREKNEYPLNQNGDAFKKRQEDGGWTRYYYNRAIENQVSVVEQTTMHLK